MSIATLYFSTTSAGLGTGVDWDNRAALFTAGVWSPLITGFSFAGSDSLMAMIGPGNYTCSQSLTSGVIAPTAANPFIAHGCDSSGNILAPPDPEWVSAQPFLTTGMPVIATTTNIATTSLANSFWRLIAFEASGRNGNVITNANLDFVSVTNSTNNTSAIGVSSAATFRNSQIIMSGANFANAIEHSGASIFSNVRMDGSLGVTGGNRQGVVTATAGIANAEMLTIIGFAGGGFFAAAGTATRFSTLRRSSIIGCGTYGFRGNPSASQTVFHQVVDSLIVNGTALGIDGQSAARIWVSNCRLRDNTSGNLSGMGNYPQNMGVFAAAGTDVDEFVDSAVKDYRIKNTSTIWGKGYGPGDQPAASGGTKSFVFGG